MNDKVGNVGYLGSKSTKDSDEVYTPYYAVEPILKYLKPNSKIWCPFDKEWSAFVKVLSQNGHEVVYTHLDNDENFFFTKVECDYIISNPPFSIKDKIIAKLYEIGKPFMLLLPVPTLQGITRGKMFKVNGLELLVYDDRVGYHTRDTMHIAQKSNHFGSMYFCWKVLPEKLIFEKLIYKNTPLLDVNLPKLEQLELFDFQKEEEKND